MFEKIHGIVENILPDAVILRGQDFSYYILLSLQSLSELPNVGEPVSILLEPIFKETGITLYGFMFPEEREVFNDLLTVSKVGPKTALNLLSIYSRNELVKHIASENTNALTKASGLGKKGASMIIAALKDKYKKLLPHLNKKGAIETIRENDDIFNEAVTALNNLGYSWEIASEAVRENITEKSTLEDLIKACLVNMV